MICKCDSFDVIHLHVTVGFNWFKHYYQIICEMIWKCDSFDVMKCTFQLFWIDLNIIIKLYVKWYKNVIHLMWLNAFYIWFLIDLNIDSQLLSNYMLNDLKMQLIWCDEMHFSIVLNWFKHYYQIICTWFENVIHLMWLNACYSWFWIDLNIDSQLLSNYVLNDLKMHLICMLQLFLIDLNSDSQLL